MLKGLQVDIQNKAKVLENHGYVFTAKWCKHISSNLYEYCNIEELSNDLTNLSDSFKDEFLSKTDFGNRELRLKCLTIVQGILEWGIKAGPNLSQTFGKALPLLEKSIMAGKPIDKISYVLSKLPDNALETRIYGTLFIFQLHIESQYFPMLRTLCSIKLTGDGDQQAVEKALDMTYDDIKNCLGDLANPLFEVYEIDGRHLRNSIAHAQFYYENEKLTCWDIDKGGNEVWRKELTIDELAAIVFDIYSINHGYMFWYSIREMISQLIEMAKKGLLKQISPRNKNM
jgi:hypothetical protein